MHRFTFFISLFITLTLFARPAPADGILCTDYDIIATAPTTGTANYTTIKDNLAYVTTSNPNGLEIFDIQDPYNPILLGRFDSPNYLYELHIAGNYAFSFSGFSTNMRVIDIADPTNPFFVENVVFENIIYDIATDQNTLYLIFRDIGLRAYDITSAPPEDYEIQHIAQYDPANFTPYVITAKDSRVYLVSQSQLRILDTTDPANPILIGSESVGFSGDPQVIKIFDNTIVIRGSNPRYTFIDVGDPKVPTKFATLSNIDIPSSGDYYLTQNHLYQTHSTEGIAVYDTASLSADVPLLGYLRLPSRVNNFATNPNHPGLGYMSTGIQGLTLLDLNAPPIQPPIIATIGTISTQSVVQHDTAGDLLAVVTSIREGNDWFSDLNLYNAPDILNPELISTTRLPYSTYDIQLVGNIAYMRSYDPSSNTDLHLYNITDLANPAPLSIYNIEDSIYDFLIDGTIIYITTSNDELHIVDFSDPINPILLGTHPLADSPRSMLLNDTTLYFSGPGLLTSYDVSDPTNPTLIVEGPLPGGSTTIDIKDQYAYISWLGGESPNTSGGGNEGFKIIDISDPKNPTLLSYFEDRDLSCEALTVIDNTLYCANRWGGISIYDVTDPLAPSKITSYGSLGSPDGISIDIENQTATIQASKIYILDLSNDCGPCPTDYTNDGLINFADVSAFVALYTQNDPIADRTFDGIWDFFDISRFLQDYAQGCP